MRPVMLRPGQWLRGDRAELAVLEWVGEGSYARVYRGEGPRGPAAIKLAKAEIPGAAERLRQEIQVRAAVSHAAIPDLFDTGCLHEGEDETVAPWLATRWVDGETLRRRLERHRALPLAQAVPAMLRIAEAVGALHAAGWRHDDLRPDNVFMEAGTHQAFLLDLGEASAAGPDAATGFKDDLRQLGALLAWSLTGADPETAPDGLSTAGGYHPVPVQLWQSARDGRLTLPAFRDALRRLARELGVRG